MHGRHTPPAPGAALMPAIPLTPLTPLTVPCRTVLTTGRIGAVGDGGGLLLLGPPTGTSAAQALDADKGVVVVGTS